MTELNVTQLSHTGLTGQLQELAGLLHSTVSAGAAVSFVQPFNLSDSETYWRNEVFPALASGHRKLFIASINETIAGTVQLIVSLPPNQSHRCEVAKLMVHPQFRNRGIARQLMQALEREAQKLAKTLITLDTRTGDAAEPLYRSLGYIAAGTIPGF
ncbi:MAG TPA: GNAT family N-acetyltransferase, partial [Hyphomicrobiaceae bacterium]|nr:GNAT family N-acetyltransferase [Hyphomicrobiaceae bacterium]